MTRISELPRFDITETLKTEEDIAVYLNLVLEENDPVELVHALDVVKKLKS